MVINRTKNAFRNIFWGIGYKIVNMFLPFLIRVILIHTLGADYLGLNGLCISILQVLNLAELGFSEAIVYSMYKPIAEDDTKEVCKLLTYFRKIYRLIGISILGIGLFLMPFLKFIIKDDIPSNVNIYIVFLIYLLYTSVSYFLYAYKNCLLAAHQRNDIANKIGIGIMLGQYTLQIIVLFVFRSYYAFIIILPISMLINNYWRAKVVDKNYPEYSCCSGELEKNTKKEIRVKVIGLLIKRVCITTRNSFDSIFVSSFVGLTAVAIYDNYYSILAGVHGLLAIIVTAVLAGVGNSIITETVEKNYDDMQLINFIYSWGSLFCAVCLLCLYNPFISLVFGKNMIFDIKTVLLFCFYFYLLGLVDIRELYVNALGLWWEDRYRSFLEAICNFVLNYLLGKKYGVNGIIMATLISIIIINFGFGSKVIFKNYFGHEKIKEYYLSNIYYLFSGIIVSGITYWMCSLINCKPILTIIIRLLICILIVNILFVLMNIKNPKFNNTIQFLKERLKTRN